MVSRRLQSHLGGEITMLERDLLLKASDTTIEVPDGEPVIWVMPVYSWGIPPAVEKFIRNIRFKGAHHTPHFLVLTCGDDIGYADNRWRKLIGRRGWNPRGSFSVIMPNTYVCMKGYTTDSPDIEASKMAAMPERVAAIAGAITRGFSGDDVIRGEWAWWKTALVLPLFNLFCTSPRPFHTTGGCTSCGTCARECPLGNLKMEHGQPVWGNNCALCLRCYHVCPANAIQYGKETAGKRQKQVFR